MKPTWFASALLLLSACTLVIDPTQGSTGTLTVKILSYETDFQDSSGKSYICDNTFTPGSYKFRFTGPLASWTSVFVGATTGSTSTPANFNYPDTTYVENPLGTIQVNFALGPGAAPLRANEIKRQAIVVVPAPQIIGNTQLRITFYNTSGNSGSVLLKGIPVINNCPTTP